MSHGQVFDESKHELEWRPMAGRRGIYAVSGAPKIENHHKGSAVEDGSHAAMPLTYSGRQIMPVLEARAKETIEPSFPKTEVQIEESAILEFDLKEEEISFQKER